MFRIARDPSSGELYTVLGLNYSNGSIVSVDMDVVGVMAAYLPVVRACVCVCVCVRVLDCFGSLVIRNTLEQF
jgi:hypothetical protein